MPSNILDYGKLGKILKEENLITIVPNPSYHPNTSALAGLRPNKTLVEITVKVDKKTRFQLFWAKKNENYHVKRSSFVELNNRVQRYRLYLPRLEKTTRIRIDPSTHPNVIIIKTITFKSLYHLPIQIDSPEKLRALSPKNGIDEFEITSHGARIVTKGHDPQLELVIDPKQNLVAGLFKKKREQSEYLYKALPHTYNSFPSRLSESSGHLGKPYPIISISANIPDLYHPDIGVIPNKQMRGRKWEKPVSVSYYDKGKLLFESNAGLRIHGGKRVILDNSYRLYFRNDYGKEEFAPGLLFSPNSEPLKRLVIHHTDWPPGWPLNNMLAYDIARKMGCVAPEFRLVHLILNGEDQGLYFLTPHQGDTQLESFFGHLDFTTFRYKSGVNTESASFYRNDFASLFNSEDKSLDFTRINSKIDLDNLARHLFSFAFCATTDYCQGAMARNNLAEDPKIFWINWDMDHSFIDVSKTYFGEKKYANRKIWEQPGWSRLLGNTSVYCKRRDLFRRLVNEHPQYRQQVARMTVDILNHQVTKTFLLKKLNEYETLLQHWGDYNKSYFNEIRKFFNKRHAFMVTDIQKWFKLGPSYHCRIYGPQGRSYSVDGFAKEGLYEGHYFEGMLATISLPDPLASDFSHWLVDGKKVYDNPLSIVMKDDKTISAVFGSKQ